MLLRPPAHRVAPRARVMWTVEAALVGVVLLVAWGVWRWLADPSAIWWAPLLIGAVVVLLLGVLLYPQLRYRTHRWERTDEAVYTQSGLLTIEQRIAPLSRVQTVDTERSLLARIFGLSTVTVTTASAKGELRIAGVERDVAARLVAELTALTAAAPGNAT